MRLPNYIDNFASWKADFSFFTTIDVRFAETDAFGHVNNSVAFLYFEQVRLQFFEACGLMEDWTRDRAVHMIVTGDLQCDYFRQMKYGDTLEVGVKVARIGSSSIELHYVCVHEEELCFTGRGRVVQVERENGKPSPLDEESLNRLTSR
ncbi:acyl-CoA thioesterase [Shouchella shacheensis]|uniref:acyl-CoA thioesterase n=1 Tax=Shouchella shacheensis TaxID=1649580 RepID=UPI00074039EA|nr:thioesterase family protein [Shouchella shacheensis]